MGNPLLLSLEKNIRMGYREANSFIPNWNVCSPKNKATGLYAIVQLCETVMSWRAGGADTTESQFIVQHAVFQKRGMGW